VFDSQGNATFSGTLYADRIVTRFGEIADLKTTTTSATYVTNVTQMIFATPSATMSFASEPDATSSALLALFAQDQSDQNVSLNANLSVLGSTILGQTTIAGGLMVDGAIQISSLGGIETFSDTLYLQKNKLADLNIMDGALVVNTLGNVIVKGDLAVGGNLTVGGHVKAGTLDVASDTHVAGTLYADRITTGFGDLEERFDAVEASLSASITNQPSPMTNGEASLSALLALGATTSESHVEITKDITLTQSLAVFGDTILGQTMIAGGLLIDGTITLTGDSIETIGDPLYIQKNRLASLDIMGGTLVVTTQGEVMIHGNLDLAGSFTLRDSFGSVVASFDQGGNARLAGDLEARQATFSGSLTTNTLVTNEASVSGALTLNDLRFNEVATDAATLGASVGHATLPAGSQTLLIDNPKVTSETLIYLTPLSSTGNQSLYVLDKTPGAGFTVAMDAPLTNDVQFNWWIVN